MRISDWSSDVCSSDLAAGFPIAVAQILLTFLLSNALLGVSPSEMLLTLPEPGAEMPAPIENREPPSIIAVLVFNVLAAVANFLSFAVLFSLLSLAFRACTGWVPAMPGNLPAAPGGERPGPSGTGRQRRTGSEDRKSGGEG